MEFNGWNNFEDFVKACGYSTKSNNDNENSTKKSADNTSNTQKNSSNTECNDIPGGFQSLNPELFIIIGSILGDIMAGSMPFNVQNSIGNWLQLVGQVILTYNAQQQYFQGGPGRYFGYKYYNENNPFCSSGTSTTNSEDGVTGDNNVNSSNNTANSKDIENIRKDINRLMSEMDEIKKKINKL